MLKECSRTNSPVQGDASLPAVGGWGGSNPGAFHSILWFYELVMHVYKNMAINLLRHFSGTDTTCEVLLNSVMFA